MLLPGTFCPFEDVWLNSLRALCSCCSQYSLAERWRGGVERWRGGEVERWKDEEVERWRGGEVER